MYILIIDDDAAIAEALSDFISMGYDYPIQIAKTNAEAIQLINKQIPKLILLDYLLTDGACDGVISHCKKLKRCPPIILLSAAGAKAHQCYIDNHLADYLSKPFDLESLDALLKKYLID